MKNPCKACAEPVCMGLCRERAEYLEWYSNYRDKVRKQIREVSRRGERDRKGTE
ncbi:hypothetical protein [Anaerostipes faecalis]|uniref:hypothetical protein n=1 Tax=Anaerostipes faecalis TaxID=2738446 RepID=UPI001C1DDD21|nr:hypothetical protein [Anaerostipes faecalis]